jgi:hypothetical protein
LRQATPGRGREVVWQQSGSPKKTGRWLGGPKVNWV